MARPPLGTARRYWRETWPARFSASAPSAWLCLGGFRSHRLISSGNNLPQTQNGSVHARSRFSCFRSRTPGRLCLSQGPQPVQRRPDVPLDADGAASDLPWGAGRLPVDAGVDRPWVLPGHPPEGIFDDDRGVAPHPQFQKEHPLPLAAAEEGLIAPGGGVPALVLHEGVVRAQVHGHGPAADGAVGHQPGGHPHVPLLLQHPAHRLLVVVGLGMAGLGALPQAVVPLGVEDAALVKARPLELMVHVGGEHEVVLLPNQVQQVPVHRPGRVHIPVVPDVPAPPGPVLLQAVKGEEAPGVHVWDAVFLLKIPEIALKPLPGVGEASRGGQPRSRPHHHGLRPVKGLSQLPDPVPGGRGRFLRQDP